MAKDATEVIVSFRAESRLIDEIDQQATKEDRTRANMIVQLLKRALKEKA